MSKEGLENAFTPLATIEKAIDFMAFYIQVAEGWLSSPKTLAVKYEDLKSSYDQEVSRLLTFLDLDQLDQAIAKVIDKYRPEK